MATKKKKKGQKVKTLRPKKKLRINWSSGKSKKTKNQIKKTGIRRSLRLTKSSKNYLKSKSKLNNNINKEGRKDEYRDNKKLGMSPLLDTSHLKVKFPFKKNMEIL